MPEEAKMAVMQEEKFKLYLNLLHNAIREYEQASHTPGIVASYY